MDDTKDIKKFNLSMPTELHVKLKISAYSKAITMNQYILSLIEKGLKQEEEEK